MGGEASVFGFEILPQPSERPAPENLAGAWHPDGGERPLSVGRRVKMLIPDRCRRSRPHAQLEPIHETCHFDPIEGRNPFPAFLADYPSSESRVACGV